MQTFIWQACQLIMMMITLVSSIPGAQDCWRPAVRPHRHPHAVAQLPHGRAQGVQRRPAQEPRQVGDRRVNAEKKDLAQPLFY